MTRSAVSLCCAALLLLTVCSRELPDDEARTASPAPTTADQPVQREVSLYFADSSLELAEERRLVVLPADPQLSLAIVASELLRGPRSEALTRVFPEDATLVSAYILDSGTAVLDLGGDTLEKGWQTGSESEILAIRSAVLSITYNFPQIRSVQFLVAGSIRATLGGHIDTSRPLLPRDW